MSNELGTSALRFAREASIAWCVIDRPAARNALTPAMYHGLKRAVRLVNSDPELAALIVTGSGTCSLPVGISVDVQNRASRCPTSSATMCSRSWPSGTAGLR